jgi:hypothetical protein
MPNIMSYLEAKRQGKTPQMLRSKHSTRQHAKVGSTPTQKILLLNYWIEPDVLEKLEETAFKDTL